MATMLFLLLAAGAAPASAAPASADAPQPFEDLSGCWRAPGAVLGKPVDGVARGEWRLGKRYFMLQLSSFDEKQRYSAAIVYGSGGEEGTVNSYWMDTMGGAYSTPGRGTARSGDISVDYHYPGSRYRNRFARTADGWDWTIEETADGKPSRIFAHYRLTAIPCGRQAFAF